LAGFWHVWFCFAERITGAWIPGRCVDYGHTFVHYPAHRIGAGGIIVLFQEGVIPAGKRKGSSVAAISFMLTSGQVCISILCTVYRHPTAPSIVVRWFQGVPSCRFSQSPNQPIVRCGPDTSHLLQALPGAHPKISA